ncbi:putative metal-binding protein [Candidatus Methanoperedens nitroreducens]|uniref:Putative metal-binding protein n=2 Tax=Candidatus Methanoperedens nitratireducens TaxID=1392998 RepID=A0A062V8E7_9EURY|nr:putative metal-binding protein [Candidatus Methanoperedens nitroreducens]
MVQMKKFFEQSGKGEFSQYYSLQISPIHVHRSKAEHKHAIFILGKEIASIMAHDEFSGAGRTSVRMQELASRAMDEMVK